MYFVCIFASISLISDLSTLKTEMLSQFKDAGIPYQIIWTKFWLQFLTLVFHWWKLWRQQVGPPALDFLSLIREIWPVSQAHTLVQPLPHKPVEGLSLWSLCLCLSLSPSPSPAHTLNPQMLLHMLLVILAILILY